MADRDDVMQDDAAVAVHGADNLGGRAQAGDDYRHALAHANIDIVLEPIVRAVDDLIDREGRSLAAARRRAAPSAAR